MAKVRTRRIDDVARPVSDSSPRPGNWLRGSIGATAALIGLLASLAGIYALSQPEIVAIPRGNHWNGQIKADPGNGIAVWIDGDVIFRNDSMRGGGFVSSIVIVPEERESADWLPPRVTNVSTQRFSAYEEKVIAFSAQSRIVQLPPSAKYPPKEVDRGAVVPERSRLRHRDHDYHLHDLGRFGSTDRR